jgi:Nucleoplasmin-like domain
MPLLPVCISILVSPYLEANMNEGRPLWARGTPRRHLCFGCSRLPSNRKLFSTILYFVATRISLLLRASYIHKLKLTVLEQFRITMAAIDPTAPVTTDESSGSTVPRATLKLIRQPIGSKEDDSEDDEDDDDYMRALLAGSESESEESEEEEANGGPSDPTKSKKARKQAALKELLESIDKGSDEEMEDTPNGTNGTKADKKGKAKATGDEEEDEDDSESDDEDLEVEEFVICTLDPEKVCTIYP